MDRRGNGCANVARGDDLRAIFIRDSPTSYTLWSRDRLLGHTELDYARIFPTSRMGEFVPTEFGESLMPVLTAAKKFAALQLELRGPNGAVIPTESIGVQDTEFLLSLNEPLEEADCGDGRLSSVTEAGFPENADRDLALFDDSFDDLESLEADFCDIAAEAWKEPVFPRFQIHVSLRDEWSIP